MGCTQHPASIPTALLAARKNIRCKPTRWSVWGGNPPANQSGCRPHGMGWHPAGEYTAGDWPTHSPLPCRPHCWLVPQILFLKNTTPYTRWQFWMFSGTSTSLHMAKRQFVFQGKCFSYSASGLATTPPTPHYHRKGRRQTDWLPFLELLLHC